MVTVLTIHKKQLLEIQPDHSLIQNLVKHYCDVTDPVERFFSSLQTKLFRSIYIHNSQSVRKRFLDNKANYLMWLQRQILQRALLSRAQALEILTNNN